MPPCWRPRPGRASGCCRTWTRPPPTRRSSTCTMPIQAGAGAVPRHARRALPMGAGAAHRCLASPSAPATTRRGRTRATLGPRAWAEIAPGGAGLRPGRRLAGGAAALPRGEGTPRHAAPRPGPPLRPPPPAGQPGPGRRLDRPAPCPATIEASVRSGQAAARRLDNLAPRPRWRPWCRSARMTAIAGRCRPCAAAGGRPPGGRARRPAAAPAAEGNSACCSTAGASACTAVDADFGGRCRGDAARRGEAVVNAARHARGPAAALGAAAPRRRALPFLPAAPRWSRCPRASSASWRPGTTRCSSPLLPAVDAIAAGNRVAIKPAETTPRTAALLAAWCRGLGRTSRAWSWAGPTSPPISPRSPGTTWSSPAAPSAAAR